MGNDTTRQGVLFKHLGKRPLLVRFDQPQASSDGGALLLKACDERLGLSAALAACLADSRQQSKIRHDYQTLFRQRMFGIACGYADANDAGRLVDDPVFKMLAGRDPLEGLGLASQPTLSRFENGVGARDLLRLSDTLASHVIQRHKRRKRRAKRITIDLDPTHDATHGGQQLSLFNGFYDSYCYLPLAGFVSFDNEIEQYLVCYVLRSGHAVAKQGCIGLLRRLVPKLRQAFPKARIRIRLDAGFAGHELYEFFDKERLEYVVCMATNAVLKRHAEALLEPMREALEAGQHYAPQFGEFRYKARSWDEHRRVIMKVDITRQTGRKAKESPRFIVTNIKRSAQWIYQRIYCQRGDAENRIKELKHGLEIDRTSCSSFKANQLRVLITAAAYVLMQELRLKARHTRFARAQVSTLRLHLLKFGAWVEVSTRRILLHFPDTAPHAQDWYRIAQSVGAIPT